MLDEVALASHVVNLLVPLHLCLDRRSLVQGKAMAVRE